MNNKISLSLSVFISVIVIFLSHYCIDDLSILHSVLFGLLSFFILHVIITSVNSDRLSKDITEIKAKLTTEHIVKSGNNFDYYWMSCSDKARAGIYTLISENCVRIPQSEIRRFWQMGIANADKNWQCTHYFNDHQDLNDQYDVNDWIKAGFELQGFIIKIFGLHAKRLFIFDKKEDITKDVIEHIKWQQSIGIEIKILILENAIKWTGYKLLLKTLGTIDIAIINNNYLMSFLFEVKTKNNKKQRSLNNIDFWSEPEKVKKVQQIYSDMWNNSLTIQQIVVN